MLLKWGAICQILLVKSVVEVMKKDCVEFRVVTYQLDILNTNKDENADAIIVAEKNGEADNVEL